MAQMTTNVSKPSQQNKFPACNILRCLVSFGMTHTLSKPVCSLRMEIPFKSTCREFPFLSPILSQEQIAYFLTQEAVHLLVHFKFVRVWDTYPNLIPLDSSGHRENLSFQPGISGFQNFPFHWTILSIIQKSEIRMGRTDDKKRSNVAIKRSPAGS